MMKSQTKTSCESRKREPLVTCMKCKNKVDPKKTILCTLCKNNFEYDCIGYSEKLHRLKDATARKNWRCKICETKHRASRPSSTLASPVASTSKQEFSKINTGTCQKNKLDYKSEHEINIPTKNSFQSLSDEETLDQTSMSPISRLNSSCPDVGKINLQEKIEELEKQNKILSDKLEIAEGEIENLLIENSELKKKLCRHENKAKYLTDLITHSSSKKNITVRHKRKSLQSTQLDFSIDGENSTPATPSDLHRKPERHVDNPIKNSQMPPQALETSEKELPDTNHNIYVVGDQQVRGLTGKLLKLRAKGWNNRYNVTGIVKPYAISSQILSTCVSLYDTITADDVLVLSLGCNDKNPYLIMTNLCNILSRLNCKIILLSIQNNDYLNVNKLNNEINGLIRNYANCTFIDIYSILTDYPLRNTSVKRLISYKINTIIDYEKYKNDYLTNIKQLQCRFTIVKNNSKIVNNEKGHNLHKKGTIPYYFKKVSPAYEPLQPAKGENPDFFRSQAAK